jgi:hypothetical protein
MYVISNFSECIDRRISPLKPYRCLHSALAPDYLSGHLARLVWRMKGLSPAWAVTGKKTAIRQVFLAPYHPLVSVFVRIFLLVASPGPSGMIPCGQQGLECPGSYSTCKKDRPRS